jgi:DNA-binding XRE family transcriptional regulator
LPAKASSKDPLHVAIGRAIQARRRERAPLPSDILAKRIGLSRSYFRAMEAGSVAPPPTVAIPLAMELGWLPDRTAELLCAVPYLAGRDLHYSTADLAARGVATPVAKALASDGNLEAAIKRFLVGDPEERAAGPALEQQRGTQPQLPWPFELAMRRMANELASVYSSVDIRYLRRFIDDHSPRITRVCAYLSYAPSGQHFKESDYNFNFLFNDPPPTLTIRFRGSPGIEEVIKSDIIETILDMTGGNGAKRDQRRDALEARLVLKAEGEPQPLRFDKAAGAVTFAPNRTGNVREFRNAWLYQLAGENPDEWVGFIDDYDQTTENFEAVALSVSDAILLQRHLYET